MQLCLDYLAARGITEDTIKLHGLELDTRLDHVVVKNRLGRHLPKGVLESLWFPLRDAAGNLLSWIARPLPTIADEPKFICPINSGGPPYIPQNVYSIAYGEQIIITEGPLKALAIMQAGIYSIGLNGAWGASAKNANGLAVIRADLQNALDWHGRKAYLGFDADYAINPKVRRALFRLFFVLSVAGAEVYQLTSWNLAEAKGIDDFLVHQLRSNGQHKPDDVLRRLLAAAKPFIQTVQATPLDLAIVHSELADVQIPKLLRAQLCKQLAGPLNVRASALEEGLNPKSEPIPDFAAEYELWPQSIEPEDLLNEIMVRIKKEVIISHQQTLVAGLEVMLTWVHPQMEFSPILFITGPDRECGKTTLLNVIAKMVRRPVKTSNVSAPAMFRLSELYHPTFLMDECQDQLQNPDFALVVKAGHTAGDAAIRCEPNTNKPERFDVFCPKLLAGIGRANSQIMSRSIILEMERRDGDTDRSSKITDQIFMDLRSKLARWALDCGDLSRFQIPKEAGIKLRNRDNWQMFYRVACAVSADVAKQLLDAIPFFIDEEQDYTTYVLDSLRKLYREHDQLVKEGHLGSEMIVAALNEDKEAPWYRGKDSKGITTERLSSLLRRYKIKSQKRWDDDIKKQIRGYFFINPENPHNSLKRVFDQYLGPEKQP